MGRLSITTAWNESAEFLKNHFGSLFTIAVALITIPNVAMQALAPGAAAPGEVPQAGAWLVLLPVVLVLGMVGSLSISTLALGRESVVGDSLRHAFRRFPAMLGAAVLLVVAALLLLAPVVLLSGIKADDLIDPTPAAAGRIALIALLILVVALFFAVRLLLLTPVAAAEPAGPLAIITRSWALSKGHFWKLLGFVLLVSVAAMVAMMAVATVVGLLIALVAGPPHPGSVGGLLLLLVTGLLNAAFVVVMTTLVARIYLQLAGPAPGPTSGR
jgi:hypothetical protein